MKNKILKKHDLAINMYHNYNYNISLNQTRILNERNNFLAATVAALNGTAFAATPDDFGTSPTTKAAQSQFTQMHTEIVSAALQGRDAFIATLREQVATLENSGQQDEFTLRTLSTNMAWLSDPTHVSIDEFIEKMSRQWDTPGEKMLPDGQYKLPGLYRERERAAKQGENALRKQIAAQVAFLKGFPQPLTNTSAQALLDHNQELLANHAKFVEFTKHCEQLPEIQPEERDLTAEPFHPEPARKPKNAPQFPKNISKL